MSLRVLCQLIRWIDIVKRGNGQPRGAPAFLGHAKAFSREYSRIDGPIRSSAARAAFNKGGVNDH